ncbi:MAG: glycosyltransferase [Gammaproteobacteria bacterium]|nr:glycosyltransferase [Gammaproteobacteria bacterium]
MAGEVRLGLFGQERASFLGGAAFARALGNSRIGINYSHDNETALYSSDRLIQLAGNGCLVMTPATPQMTRLFSEDEVVYFESPAQLPELVRKYLRDESECIRRARAGWRRAHGSYNERRAARFIVEAALGQPFGEAYEWLDAAERPPPVPSVPGDA